MISYYFLAVLAGFLENVTFFHWWSALVVILASFRPQPIAKVFVLAFFAGIFSDLLSGRWLGQTALSYLALAAITNLLKSRFHLPGRRVDL